MRSMSKLLPGLALAGAAAALAACNSGSAAPAPPGPCGSPAGVSQTVLVYPAPGATAVPDSIPLVIVGSTSAIPAGWSVAAVTNTGQGAIGTQFTVAPTPLPSPNQTPSFANPVYQSSSVNASPPFAGTVVTVYLNNLNSSCVPSVPLGTFTTQ